MGYPKGAGLPDGGRWEAGLGLPKRLESAIGLPDGRLRVLRVTQKVTRWEADGRLLGYPIEVGLPDGRVWEAELFLGYPIGLPDGRLLGGWNQKVTQ